MNYPVAVPFQGVSAVDAFYELLSQDSLSVMHPEANRSVAPVEMCPILKALHRILIMRLEPKTNVTYSTPVIFSAYYLYASNLYY
jgi:hypothetical protein